MSKSQTKWKIKFYPNTGKNTENGEEKKSMPINMLVSFGRGKRLKFYTREHAKKSDYLQDYLKRVEQDSYFFRPLKPQIVESTEKNGRLEALAKETLRLILSADNADPPIAISVDYLRSNLKYFLDGDQFKKKPGQAYLSDVFDKYLQFSFKQKAANSTKNDKQLVTKFEAFLVKKNLGKIALHEIDQSLADDFHSYLLGLKLLNNTVAKHMRSLKAFMNWCKKKGLIVNEIALNVKENIPEVIYLTEEELMSVETAVITNPTFEWVRDLFIFSCYTGMRVADILKLKKSDYYDGQIIHFEKKGHKTTSNSIPIVGGAEDVVKKYQDFPSEYLLPHKTSQVYNRFLKKLLEKVGIDKSIKIAEQRGGEVDEKVFPKYELVSSHLARKTFITIALIRGMPEAVIKSITGHSKNSRAFARYYDIADVVKSQNMHKYFGNSNKEDQ